MRRSSATRCRRRWSPIGTSQGDDLERAPSPTSPPAPLTSLRSAGPSLPLKRRPPVQTYTYKLGGSEVTINFPETDADLGGFREFLSRGDKILGFDTEGTGLDTYSQGHAVRLVQFGNDREAWVLRVDRFREEIRAALSQPRHFVAHNAPFDLLEVDAHLGIPLEELGPKMFDTKVLAHLDNSSRD